jgi:hypothetical protein
MRLQHSATKPRKGIYILASSCYRENLLYQEYTNMKLEEMKNSYLGLFQGDEDLYGKPCGADPCPKSRLGSCSINCDLRSLKKSSLVVSSTRVDDGTGGCLPYSTACVYNKSHTLVALEVGTVTLRCSAFLTSIALGMLVDNEPLSAGMLVATSLESLEQVSKECLREKGFEEA